MRAPCPPWPLVVVAAKGATLPATIEPRDPAGTAADAPTAGGGEDDVADGRGCACATGAVVRTAGACVGAGVGFGVAGTGVDAPFTTIDPHIEQFLSVALPWMRQ